MDMDTTDPFENPVLAPEYVNQTIPTTELSLWNTLVAHVLSRDNAGSDHHHHDPAQHARRKRVEWPMENPVLRNMLLFHRYLPYSKCTPGSFGDLVLQNELDRCARVHPNRQDLPVLNYDYRLNDDVTVIKNLYYRGRRQSAVWDLFELLVSRGFMDYTCLGTPYDSLAGIDANIEPLWALLSCFDGPITDELRSWMPNEPQIPLKHRSSYDHDLQWLATMIVRCGRNLTEMFDTIQASRILGEFRTQHYAQVREHRTYIDHVNLNVPEQGIGNMHPNNPNYTGLQAFGFWLPHSVNMNDLIDSIREHLDRFNRMEAAFRDVMHLSPQAFPIVWEEVDYRNRRWSWR